MQDTPSIPMNTSMQTPPAAGQSIQAASRLARLSLAIPLFAVSLILVVWVAVGAVLYAERQNELSAVVRQNRNLCSSIEEQVLRVLASTDQALLRLSDAASTNNVSPEDLVRFANETGLTPGILVQLSLIDTTGHFVGSNIDPTGEHSGHVDLSQREHVRIHLDPANLEAVPPPVEGLFIGKPVLGKVSVRWTVQLSRKVLDAGGRLRGVVVASLDPSYFQDVFGRVKLGPAGSVSLVGADLTIRARVVGGSPVGMGSTLPTSGTAAQAFARASGDYHVISSIDHIERVLAFRQVSRYPLFVVVATGKDEALAAWRTSRNVVLSLVGLLSSVVALAVAAFVAGVRRLERANAALQVSEAQAQSASRAKSAFLVAMSHELRTPLTSIRGFAELLEHRLENPRFREQAGLIRKGAEYLNNLFNDILDLAKVEAGAMHIKSSRVEIRPFMFEICEFFHLSAGAKQLRLDVEVSYLVPGFVSTDPLRLKQILSNLLSNAIKFTPHGKVTVKVDVGSEGRIRFAVADSGPGIPVGMHEIIFERFQQGGARISYEHGGTGLGLALSRSLAERMGGRLAAQTDVQLGAEFVLSLPLVPA